jgi:hypothetical protein
MALSIQNRTELEHEFHFQFWLVTLEQIIVIVVGAQEAQSLWVLAKLNI